MRPSGAGSPKAIWHGSELGWKPTCCPLFYSVVRNAIPFNEIVRSQYVVVLFPSSDFPAGKRLWRKRVARSGLIEGRLPFLAFPGLDERGTWRRHCQNKPNSVSLFKEHHVRPPCGAGSSRNRRRPAPFRPQPCIRPAVSRRRWRARPGNSMPTLTGASRRSWA